jgi:hypothetical protein
MPMFGQGKDPAEAEAERARQQADAQARQQAKDSMFQWASSVPPAELAVHLMPRFADEASADLADIFRWLGCWDDSFMGGNSNRYSTLEEPILDAMQLLEHAELVRVAWCGEYRPQATWSPTRLGSATLAQGNEAVRQRIRVRTGM